MLDPLLLEALNEQLTLERTNQAYYDALAAACDVAYWPGTMIWMKKAALEEYQHGDKIAEYITDRDGVPQFGVIEAVPMMEALNLLNVYEQALRREEITTERIKMLHALSEQQGDPQTCEFLLWFIHEQTESEAVLRDYITLLRRLDNNGRLLFDKEMLD